MKQREVEGRKRRVYAARRAAKGPHVMCRAAEAGSDGGVMGHAKGGWGWVCTHTDNIGVGTLAVAVRRAALGLHAAAEGLQVTRRAAEAGGGGGITWRTRRRKVSK